MTHDGRATPTEQGLLGYYSSVEVSATLSTPWRGLAKLGARGSSTRFIFKPANEEQLAEKGDDGREIVSDKLKVSDHLRQCVQHARARTRKD